MRIPFNKPHLTGKETEYISQAVASGKISGNGIFTKKCHDFFTERYGFGKCLLTNSCTDALEMAAILLDIQPGDEVIIPSYTFVSTANAFMLRGAHIKFADSGQEHPNVNVQEIEKLISPKCKAIVVVHYAGMACDMDALMKLSDRYQIPIVEDAAQAIDAYYKDKALGGIGHLAAFSFQETKNIISGEGGMLVINEVMYQKRAEIIWEKGTNRTAFFRGEVDKYTWLDLGSSFLPSEVIAAFLYAQLEKLEVIQEKRIYLWNRYKEKLGSLEKMGVVQLPKVPKHSSNNAHIFYLICRSQEERRDLIAHVKESGIWAVFHYLALHRSPFIVEKFGEQPTLGQADFFESHLLRIPLFFDLSIEEQDQVIEAIRNFFLK